MPQYVKNLDDAAVRVLTRRQMLRIRLNRVARLDWRSWWTDPANLPERRLTSEPRQRAATPAYVRLPAPSPSLCRVIGRLRSTARLRGHAVDPATLHSRPRGLCPTPGARPLGHAVNPVPGGSLSAVPASRRSSTASPALGHAAGMSRHIPVVRLNRFPAKPCPGRHRRRAAQRRPPSSKAVMLRATRLRCVPPTLVGLLSVATLHHFASPTPGIGYGVNRASLSCRCASTSISLLNHLQDGSAVDKNCGNDF